MEDDKDLSFRMVKTWTPSRSPEILAIDLALAWGRPVEELPDLAAFVKERQRPIM